MEDEELIETLRLFEEKRVEQLPESARQLFYAIMKIADERDRLKKIACKMHTWIFLHSSDEQKVYDELGLTDEENTMLGYSGQIKIEGDKE